jgi:hypothetical protein
MILSSLAAGPLMNDQFTVNISQNRSQESVTVVERILSTGITP